MGYQPAHQKRLKSYPKSYHHVQDVIALRAMTLMPQNPINTHYYILLHSSQSLSPVYLPELWITCCCMKLIYQTLQGKEVMYVLPITSILGRLPVVLAED